MIKNLIIIITEKRIIVYDFHNKISSEYKVSKKNFWYIKFKELIIFEEDIMLSNNIKILNLKFHRPKKDLK